MKQHLNSKSKHYFTNIGKIKMKSSCFSSFMVLPCRVPFLLIPLSIFSTLFCNCTNIFVLFIFSSTSSNLFYYSDFPQSAFFLYPFLSFFSHYSFRDVLTLASLLLVRFFVFFVSYYILSFQLITWDTFLQHMLLFSRVPMIR